MISAVVFVTYISYPIYSDIFERNADEIGFGFEADYKFIYVHTKYITLGSLHYSQSCCLATEVVVV